MVYNRFFILLVIVLGYSAAVSSQDSDAGVIEGRIYNQANNEPIAFANLII